MPLDEELIVKPLTVKKWNGSWPAKCDMCKTELSNQSVFYDAKTIQGPWALMCPKCFKGLTWELLGTGRGQKYDSKTLEKLEG
jgi:hypothetical protein